ncbi:unnamed protein product [Boreogadus saida]
MFQSCSLSPSQRTSSGFEEPYVLPRDSRLQRLLLADTFCPGPLSEGATDKVHVELVRKAVTTETFLLSEDPGRGGHGIPECYVVSDSYRVSPLHLPHRVSDGSSYGSTLTQRDDQAAVNRLPFCVGVYVSRPISCLASTQGKKKCWPLVWRVRKDEMGQ